MNTWTLVRAGLLHGARRHLGVVLGVAVASAVLVGALAVGDSVRGTLVAAARARSGAIDAVLVGGDRFFREALPGELGAERAAPVLQLLGVAATPAGDQRVHDVRVLGIDASYFEFAPRPASVAVTPPPRHAYASAGLADALGLVAGDTLIVRVEKPSAIPRDLALSPDDNSAALRVTLDRVLTADEFGEFALDAAPGAAQNLFIDLAWLQTQMGVEGRVNLALLGGPAAAPVTLPELSAELERRWTLDDASLHVETLAGGQRELVTRRIFFDEPVVRALDALTVSDASPGRDPVALTGAFVYFVNAIIDGEREIPYSMVAAFGPLGSYGIGSGPPDPLLELVADLGPNEVRLNGWAMDDLEPEVGAELVLDYYVIDASRKLVTQRHTFTLAGRAPDVLGAPLEGTQLGRELMPDFPGLADADHCREWEPGTPVDLDRIRDVDEAYWERYRGTPKAFITLEAGRALWSSRFGALTGVRFQPADEARVLASLRSRLDAPSVGLLLRDVRAAAQRASDSPTDFGGLFLGLSFFLVVAALLLTTQLFLFGVEARASELGMLGAVGLRDRLVARLVLGETALLAVLGAALGAPLGLLYTQGVLRGLETLWADAVARTTIEFHAAPTSVALGASLAIVSTLAAAGFGLRRLLRRSSLALLQSARGVFEDEEAPALGDAHRTRRAGRSLSLGGALALIALGLALAFDPAGGVRSAGAYFGAGAALACAGLCVVRAALHARRRRERTVGSLLALGATNATRRKGRSLGTVASMGLGVFLVLAVGANRIGPVRDGGERASGTGGFAFYGRTSLPLLHDLEAPEGRAFFGLEAPDLAGVSFVRMRVRDGDDASCLSLARPGPPRLLGVDAEALATRAAFPFAKTLRKSEAPWRLLDEPQPDGAVPAIGDVTSLTWQLKLGVGDTLRYVDERGREFDVRIVAALADTILQGDLVISERAFEARFPGQSGYRRLLVDAPPERASEVQARLSRALSDVGLALEPTGARLDRFHAVQNTYLAIFQALGALGLLVGSIGLGLLVLRNTEERRGELALLGALGFAPRRITAVVFAEYGALLAAGLAVGVCGAGLAMLPVFVGAGSGGSLAYVALLAALVGLAGIASIAAAVAWVARRARVGALGAE